MHPYKKIFIGYCAFSPFIAAVLAFHLGFSVSEQDTWNLALVSVICCSPFSLYFSLIALHRPKSGRMATVASSLASDGHLLFFIVIWMLAEHPQIFTSSSQPMFAGIIALLMSGIALLLIWDNEENKNGNKEEA